MGNNNIYYYVFPLCTWGLLVTYCLDTICVSWDERVTSCLGFIRADCSLPDLKVDSWACTITHNTHSLCDSVLNLQVPGALHK